MTDNPLKKAAIGNGIPYERDPMVNPRVAREWAAHADQRGLREQAQAWARHAWELEQRQGPDGKTLAAGQ